MFTLKNFENSFVFVIKKNNKEHNKDNFNYLSGFLNKIFRKVEELLKIFFHKTLYFILQTK